MTNPSDISDPRELVMACEVLFALVDIFFVLQDWIFDLMIAFLFAE